MRCRTIVGAAAAVAACSGSGHASFIPLGLLDAPDVMAGFTDVTYDAGSDAFLATGFALEFDDGTGPAGTIFDGSFSITASIDETGAPGGGTLDIGGLVSGFGLSLLTGTLLDFGFDDTGGTLLEFQFQVTGGDLAPQYGGPGAAVGVILDMGGGGYSGNFLEDFDNLIGGLPGTGLGVADTGRLIPGPSAIALLAMVAARRRRRARRS
ncbi:MAG: hypothetical protein ACYTGF_01075 [Planctomycetota bacterium]